ncbi:MAG: GatB/YqeY domain-containing protein [Anaerolineae bacterium]|nr:MAG: GatB/YqeY domain-containing protein [Anaerolineae bacterium]
MYNRAMPTRKDFESQLKGAIRDGDDLHKRTLRLVLSEWKLAEVERGSELDESAALALLQKQAKTRRETIADAERAGRTDIVESTQAELDYLETFLPQPLSQSELERLARESIQETGATDPAQMGLVMKDLMPRLEGRAEGKQASEVVRNLLSSDDG